MEKYRPLSTMEKIVTLLCNIDSRTPTWLAERTGVSLKQIYSILAQLTTNGTLSRFRKTGFVFYRSYLNPLEVEKMVLEEPKIGKLYPEVGEYERKRNESRRKNSSICEENPERV